VHRPGIVTKNMSLAKAESTIQLLVARACTLLPPGDSRKSYKDMEGCTTLIRALPPNSSTTASTLYQNLTTRMQRACTMNELFRALEQYRGNIDKDIKANGANFAGNYKNRVQNRADKYQRGANTFFATTEQTEQRKNYPLKSNFRPNSAQNANRNTDVSYTPRPKNRQFKSNIRPRFQNGYPTRSGQNNRPAYQNNQNNSRNCSLCGKGHKATECKNIRDDKGKIVNILPGYKVCDKCPEYIKPRLHHPEHVCPYRKGGPFNKN